MAGHLLKSAALLLLAAGAYAAPAPIPLIEAAKNADAAAIQRLIDEGVDVDAADSYGMTALHWAIRLRNVAAAEALVRARANVGALSRHGVAPLSLACTSGTPALVRLLLGAGADPETSLPGGESALMTAARSGSVESISLLLSHGANVNASERGHGQTALMWAAAEGHTGVVRTLIEAGADLKARSTGGFTALLFAARDGHLEAVRALLAAGSDPREALPRRGGKERAPVAGEGSGLDAFLLAAGNAHYELALALIDAGADPNAAPLGWTALHQITAVRKVGLFGSNDSAPEGSGAVTSLAFVRQLVARGADVNARATRQPPLGRTMLNAIGATPFLLAARTADAALMRELAALGADPLMPNADGTTPLMVAAGVGTSSPPEDPGTEPEVVEAVKVALELGNDVNAVDARGETAMHGAAYKQIPAAVRLLADRGAKVEIWNRKNRKGWTPLKITQGVRLGNSIYHSTATEAAVREVMMAAGVEPVVPPGSSTEPADGTPYQ